MRKSISNVEAATVASCEEPLPQLSCNTILSHFRKNASMLAAMQGRPLKTTKKIFSARGGEGPPNFAKEKSAKNS